MLVYNKEDSRISEEEEPRAPGENETVWIDLSSPDGSEVERIVGRMFGGHPLMVEDCMKMNQRTKMDQYNHHVFITFFYVNTKLHPIEIGIVVGDNYIITIHREPVLYIADLRRECLAMPSRMDNVNALLYHLLDRCVDGYADLATAIEDQVDKFERMLFRNPYVKVAEDVFKLKRTIHRLRRIFAEEKMVISSISHHGFAHTKPEHQLYYADVQDHLSRVIDSFDVFRENINGLLELQMSMKADRMNEIIKTLTIVSSIFLPLTFIVGLYGMNFTYIPELKWRFGYSFAWLLMGCVAVGMWLFYKYKKWL